MKKNYRANKRIEKKVKEGIKKLSADPIKTTEKFIERESEILNKIEYVGSKIGKSETVGPVTKFINKIQLIYMCVKDYINNEYTNIPWRTIAGIIFALIYFLNPFDIIPDFIPGIGYIDDATVLLIIWKAVEEDLKTYAKWKGLSSDEYF